MSSLYKVPANGGMPAPVNDYPCVGTTATHVVAKIACVACSYSDTGTNVFCSQIGVTPTAPFGGTTGIGCPSPL